MRAPESILPLELADVSYGTGRHRLIKNISCRFEEGRRYFVIGPNGAGKTLLLRLCHGLLRPDGGSLHWHGAAGQDPARHQAMVFQRPVMMRRTARANMDFALAAQGVGRAERRRRIGEVLARTGLERIADQPARLLSLGEQQRLALARAWALRPQVLFLDEPTASLDPPAAHAIEALIGEIADGGTTIIMTTHDLGQARRMADEILFLFRGRLKEQAPAERFFAGPRNDLARDFLAGRLLWWKRRRGGGYMPDAEGGNTGNGRKGI